MKRIIIICEGETEREFCTKLLAPIFAEKEIYIQAPLIKKSMGGIVKWYELKKQILMHLKSDTTATVTTLIDYYGLYKKYQFPGWDESLNIMDKNLRMNFLEHEMLRDIDKHLRVRYYPYIQLHEFEGLLFNDLRYFKEQIPKNELIDEKALDVIFKTYTNPEMINNQRDTSPSHRLQKIIAGYNKLVYGVILAEAIGIENIRLKCPRFNNWLFQLGLK